MRKNISFDVLSILFLISTLANARDLTTTTGETFYDVDVLRVEGNGIVIKHRNGVGLINCSSLSENERRVFGCPESVQSVIGDTYLPNLTTNSGEIYYDVKVTRVEKMGIGITHRSGVVFIDFSLLSDKVRRQYGYSEEQYLVGKQDERDREQRLRQAEQARVQEAQAASYGYSSTTYPDFSLPSYSSRSFGGDYSRRSAGTEVFVHDYYRRDGTHVNSHTRSLPHSRR